MGNCHCVKPNRDAERLKDTINFENDTSNMIDKGTAQRSKQIEKYMKDIAKKEAEKMKILLLGAGSSGKSTIFRQIECIHGEEHTDNEYESDDKYFVDLSGMKRTIRMNCVYGLVKLLQKSESLSKEPHNIAKCAIDFEEETIIKAIQIVVGCARARYESNPSIDDSLNNDDLSDLANAMVLLWDLCAVKETFKHRHFFSLIENLDFFLDKVSVVMAATYEPSMRDILNARVKTTGIIERVYWIEKIEFNIFDVGGQRNERRKWIQLFDAVNGLIFVAALNHYCCVLFEDERTNAMQESLQLFDEIVNAKWFSSKHTQFILFLNKNDLFIKRLRQDRIPLSVCFSDEYKGPNYCDKSEESFTNEPDRNAWFDKCYQESVGFIKDQYLEKNGNKRISSIFTHVTTATEKSNVQRVFDDVRMGILSRSLATSGFHVDRQTLEEMKRTQ